MVFHFDDDRLISHEDISQLLHSVHLLITKRTLIKLSLTFGTIET
jgi:hypothetical protein